MPRIHSLTFYCVMLCCALTLVPASSSSAGELALHPDAFNDGIQSWTGSFSLNTTVDSVTLIADLDFAVFTAADFNANYGGLGYTPDGPLVYTYQLLNNGTQSITTEIVGLSNAVSSIGTFNIGDVDASTTALGPDARWDFSPGVGSLEDSYGLVFSSPNLPMLGNSLTVSASQQGFLSAFQFGVPTPGAVAIPEPASLFLLGLGGLVAMTQLTRKRRA